MRRSTVILGLVVLVLGIAAFYAFAGEGRGIRAQERGETRAAQQQTVATTDPALMRSKELANARFVTTEPVGLIALREELGLTADQVRRLKDIDDKARRDAQGVLTGNQMEIVSRMDSTPDSLVALCQDFSNKGQRCPVFDMVEGRGAAAAPKPGARAEERRERTARTAPQPGGVVR